MAPTGLRDAIAANLEWLSYLRLTDRIEPVWLWVPAGMSVLLLAACLAFSQTHPLNSVIGAAAHLCFVVCLYYAAARHWLLLFALIVFLSEINLVIFVASSGPKLGVILQTYGVLALVAPALAALIYRSALLKLGELDGTSKRDDFRWLVTTAPLALRQRARRTVLDLSEGAPPSRPKHQT